jgi:hypothetical protein
MSSKLVKTERFELRLEPETLAKIDEWRANRSNLTSRSEAVRALIEIGLGKREQLQLFHLARFNLRVAALQEGAGSKLSNAYIYAWENGVYPAFDEGAELHKPFADGFLISPEMVDELSKYLDDRWRKKNVPTFYELEDHYDLRRGGGKWDRHKLIITCRYMFLHDLFDKNFWKKLLEPMEHPSEAGRLTREFHLNEEVYLN